MVHQQLIARGIRDERLLEAMRKVPREHFISNHQKRSAYEDHALPIGLGQSISQPYMIARTCELAMVHPGTKVLDVGLGSGYQSAILSTMGAEVFAIERLRKLTKRANQALQNLNIVVRTCTGDGTQGWPDHAPYDAIVVGAAGPRIPETLKAQLAIGGRLIIPIGERELQTLMCVVRTNNTFRITAHLACRYVPLIGAEGWQKHEVQT